jgi:hypothetical protein
MSILPPPYKETSDYEYSHMSSNSHQFYLHLIKPQNMNIHTWAQIHKLVYLLTETYKLSVMHQPHKSSTMDIPNTVCEYEHKFIGPCNPVDWINSQNYITFRLDKPLLGLYKPQIHASHHLNIHRHFNNNLWIITPNFHKKFHLFSTQVFKQGTSFTST